MHRVVWPRGKRVTGVVQPAKRLDTLEAKTIGELWNWRFCGDKILPILERELAKRYVGLKFVDYEVFGNIHGRDAARVLADFPDRLRQNKCDAVICGVGC